MSEMKPRFPLIKKWLRFMHNGQWQNLGIQFSLNSVYIECNGFKIQWKYQLWMWSFMAELHWYCLWARVSSSKKIMYLSLFMCRCQKKFRSYLEDSEIKLIKNSDCVTLSNEIKLLICLGCRIHLRSSI